MHRILSISLNWEYRFPEMSTVDDTLNRLGGDWVRFSPYQWFFWTDLSQVKLRDELNASLSVPTHMIVTVLEPIAGFGATHQWIWDWLNAKMKDQLDSKFIS